MKYRYILAAFLVVPLLGCPSVDPSDKRDDDGNNTLTNNVTDPDMGGGGDDDGTDGEDAGGDDEPDMTVEFGEIPDAIDSSGARFAGRLAAGERITMTLTVFQADRATLWLRKINGTDWDPSVSVIRANQSEPLAWGNPDGNEDAVIPFRASEQEDGFEFWFSDTYTLLLQNRGDTDGEFEFTLECKGGPCAVESGDADLDGTPDGSDDCPFNPGDCSTDPYGSDSNGDLESAIRSDDRGRDVLNYVEARVHMFAWIDNVDGQVEGVYTGKKVTTVEIPDTTELNTEHTWPQSRSGGDQATESDLHQLFPTDPIANDERGSLNFGEVTSPQWQEGGSSAGNDSTGNTKFEPRDEHKGTVARTMFYYAVIYQQDIPSWEEDVLRDWHEAFPADDVERRRNQAIEHVQGSRNPFVDYPGLVDRISDF